MAKHNIIATKKPISPGTLHHIEKHIGNIKGFAPEVEATTVYDSVQVDDIHRAIHGEIDKADAKAQKGLDLAEENAGKVANNEESLAQIGERLDTLPTELIKVLLSDEEVVNSLVGRIRSSIDPILEQQTERIKALESEVSDLRASLSNLEDSTN